MIKRDKWELLRLAEQRIHDKWSVDDSGSLISLHNIKLGLAKILSVQNYLGYPLDAHFISSPDLTPPKGLSKWMWGLAAGGLLSWGDGSRPLIFLDPRVSIGSALVGGVYEPMNQEKIYENIKKARSKSLFVMGIPSQWDYNKGNHFINIYQTSNKNDSQLPPFVFILHGSAKEITGPNKLGDGLDYQKSSQIRERMKQIDTPLGKCLVLIDSDADDFIKQYRSVEKFALEKHLTFAKQIFGDFTLISNKVHHGFVDSNNVILGSYLPDPDDQDLYPITLRPDLSSYLVKGNPNHFTKTVIPHGGGVTFPCIKNILKDFRFHDGSQLILEAVNGNQIVVERLQSLDTAYRGVEVIECAERNELIDIVTELTPLYCFLI